jgi:CheY-like chemotaxis protein
LPPRKLCVLIIDDNIDAAHSLAALCEHLGHDVDLAYDGTSGLEGGRRLRPNTGFLGLAHPPSPAPRVLPPPPPLRPDIVFADLALPGIDGYEVARLLRAELPHRDLVLIAVSGFGNEEDRQRSRAAGFDHHLVKPADPAFIESLLRRLP